jgi:hypothetical protein
MQMRNPNLVNDLLDCPFCGATQSGLDKAKGKGVYTYMDALGEFHQVRMHVACLECGSGSPSVEVWNRRQNSK